MSEWKECKLGDIAEIQTGPFGSQLHQSDYVASGIPSIMPTNIGNRLNIVRSNLAFIESDDAKRLSKYLVDKGDIVYSRRGDVEKCAYIRNDEVGWLCGTGCLRIRINKRVSIPRFIAYYLSTEESKGWISNNAVGSTMPNLNSSILQDVPLSLPSLFLQEQIVRILSSLDDKIDLLNCQNATLEAMAETLFRQYFIENPKEGWKLTTLGKYVISTNGVSYKSDDLNVSTTAMATLKSFHRDGGFKLDGYKEYTGGYKPNQTIDEGDLLVAHTDITQDAAVIGNPVLVISDPKYDTLTFSMDLVKVEPIDHLSREVLYLLMKSTNFKEHCLGYANGSTVLHLSKKAIPEFEFIMPATDIVEKLQKGVVPLVDKLFANHKQILTLTQLRDTLLPKLMNREITING